MTSIKAQTINIYLRKSVVEVECLCGTEVLLTKEAVDSHIRSSTHHFHLARQDNQALLNDLIHLFNGLTKIYLANRENLLEFAIRKRVLTYSLLGIAIILELVKNS